MANPGNLTDEQMQALAQRIAALADTPTDAPAPGVRQYVGARYVPLFAEPLEWSDTREYEPLTIVTYNGNSYTSRQYVPTGIEITNSEYWALTGNFNAQVEAYRAEVAAFDGRITANATAIANETSARETAIENEKQARMAMDETLEQEIKDAITAYEAADRKLQGQIDDLKNDTSPVGDDGIAIFLGDSIGAGWSSEEPNGTGWPIYLAQKLNIPSDRYFNVSNGGCSFAPQGTTNFNAELETAKTNLNNAGYKNSDVKLIVVAGGVNDARNQASSNNITQGVNNLIGNINNNFPNAKVHVFIGLMANSGCQPTTLFRYKLVQESIAQYAANNSRNIASTICWDWFYDYSYTTANNYTSSDHIHLKSLGNLVAAGYMATVLNGGTVDMFWGTVATTTSAGQAGPNLYRQGYMVTATFAQNFTTGGSDNLLITCPNSYNAVEGCLGLLCNPNQDTNYIVFPKRDKGAIATYTTVSNQGMYGTLTWKIDCPFG